MNLLYFTLVYLLIAALLGAVWHRKDKFPDDCDFIDWFFIGLILLFWPVTLGYLVWALYFKKDLP